MFGSSVGLLMLPIMLVMFALGALGLAFWVWMIVDCVKRKKLSDGERIAWMLVIVFLGFFGAVIYYFAVKRT